MNEIIKGMSYPTYDSRKEYINAGKLIAVQTESMKTVKAMIDGDQEFTSDAFEFGIHFHSMILEGIENFVVQPKEYAFGKKWHARAAFCEQWALKQTKPIVTEGQVSDLRGMCKTIREHPELSPLLCGQVELSIFVDRKGPKLKARVDLLPDGANSPVIDFKKTRSARPEDFVRQMYDLKYYLKAALYLDVLSAVGIHREEFWLVAVEDRAPYNVYICKLVDRGVGFIEYGRMEYRAAYHKLMRAMQTGYWPSYDTSEAETHMTAWMMSELEQLA